MADNAAILATSMRAYWDRWKLWLDANPDADQRLVQQLLGRGEPPPDRKDTAVFIDDWKTATAVHQAFDRLRQAKQGYPHAQRMIDTITAVVDAELSGQPITAVFERPDVCHETTWYKKWQHDPDVAACMTAVRESAQGWEDTARGLALAQAARLLAVSSPKAAQKAIAHIDSHDPNVSLRASLAVLDRAGVETAVKSSQTIDVETADDVKDAVMDKLSKMRRTLQGRGEGTDE